MLCVFLACWLSALALCYLTRGSGTNPNPNPNLDPNATVRMSTANHTLTLILTLTLTLPKPEPTLTVIGRYGHCSGIGTGYAGGVMVTHMIL